MKTEPEKINTMDDVRHAPKHTHTDPQAVPELHTKESVPLLAPVPFYKGKEFLVLLFIVVILIGGGYYAYSSGIFEPAVAEVNGVKISQSKFDEGVDLIEKNAVAQGINLAEVDAEDLIKQQVLDVLIINTLIASAAKNLGIEVTKEEVDERYAELVSVMKNQLGPDETIESRMAAAGISEVKLKETLEEQIVADKYIEAVTDIKKIQVSDKEITEFYNNLTENSADSSSIPPLEEIKGQIDAQLKLEKEQEIIGSMLDKLRSEADIKITI